MIYYAQENIWTVPLTDVRDMDQPPSLVHSGKVGRRRQNGLQLFETVPFEGRFSFYLNIALLSHVALESHFGLHNLGLVGFNFLKYLIHSLAGRLQLIGRLQIHPIFRCRIKKLAQP